MDGFITAEMLTTFAGAVAVVTLLTQLLKGFIPKLDPRLVALVFSVIIVAGFQILTGVHNVIDIIISVINAVIVSIAATGAFENLVKPIKKMKEGG